MLSRAQKCDIYSTYKICAISRAAGILANRKTSIRRGFKPRQPYAKRPLLATYSGFKIVNGVLKVPVGGRQYFDIALNSHVRQVLSDPSLTVRSITLIASNTVSICYSKEVAEEIECTSIEGVDRNLGNLTVGNARRIVQYDLSKAVSIAENTRSVVRSFKRNDARIRRKIAGKYGQRRRNRVNQLLHYVSKSVVQKAKQDKEAIAFEDITHIRRLYQRGNGQGRYFRSKLNGWSLVEIKRLISYKAQWEGVRVIQLSVKETRGTSQLCPRCGKKITQVDRKGRQLYCFECKRWMDRDIVAALNLSIKGRSRFERSQGAAGEAMRGNPGAEMPVILRVDVAKLSRYYCQQLPKVDRVVYQPKT
jgi:putative transposase